MEAFRPSIEWGDQLVESALWIVCCWAISALCVLAILVLLMRYTAWGQRFWHITGGYFTGAASAPVWAMLAVLLLSVIAAVRLEVLFSYYHNDLYSALQVAFQGRALTTPHSAVRECTVSGSRS